MSEFTSQLLELIKNASSNKLPQDSDSQHQLQVLDKLLSHHKNLILGKQQIMAHFMAAQSGSHQQEKSGTKQDKRNR